MPIRILPEHIASQIAAGEVIERPASVVKELAGSRHATSKLARAEDLFRIATLGFRGEALASIGSVSRLTVESRTPDAETGAILRVEGGKLGAVSPLGMPQGTRITVQDLFYNVPARLKFLKTDTTERRNIEALVTRYALAYPHVRWELAMEGKRSLQTSGNGDRREVLAGLYGVDVAKEMLAVEFREEGYHIHGFISPISMTRSNRRELTVFVNGRWVRDTAVTAAIIRAYHTLLMVGRFPIVVLFLELPPEAVDVNVHPAKAEVRFREGDVVFARVQRAVKRALLAYSPVPELDSRPWWGSEQAGGDNTVDPAWAMAAQIPAVERANPDLPQARIHIHTGAAESADQLPLLRLVGQVASTYLVAEGPDGLYLIDQHAAHERVLFEGLLAQSAHERVTSQALLAPVNVALPPDKSRLLEEQLPVLAGLGFEVEPFGPNTYTVRAIPSLLAGGDPEAALHALVEDFEEDETPLASAREAQITARICKRMAVKGGQTLSTEEQAALLRGLERCQSPRTCPHGRPTMIHLSADLLERQFGRRGAR